MNKDQPLQHPFDLNDRTIYLWEIAPVKRRYVLGITVGLFLAIWGYTCMFGMLYGIGLLSVKAAYFLSLLFCFYGIVVQPILWFSRNESLLARLEQISEEASQLYRVIGRIYKSSQLTSMLPLFGVGAIVYALWSPESHFNGGFEGASSSFWEWHLFAVENITNVLTLNAIEIFNISISDISPVTWYGRTISIVLNVLIAAGIVESIFGMGATYFKKEEFYGSLEDIYHKYGTYSQSRFQAIGRVEKVHKEPFSMEDLTSEVGDHFDTMVDSFRE